ncbi:MAG: hypothetical protein DRJ01_06715 [Bacteroidetes bacterium]|nr:MAG: hypothetical protein DRJ01_06715 [Bacteroidota bacterium]
MDNKIIIKKFDNLWNNMTYDEYTNLTNFEFFQAGFFAGRKEKIKLQKNLIEKLEKTEVD